MKIGIFTEIYYPYLNGFSVAVNNLARELEKKGHTVYLFAPKIEGYKDSDPNIFRLPSSKIPFLAPEIRLPILFPNKSFRKVFELDLDLIHAHGGGPFCLLAYQIAKIKGIPFVLTFHTLLTEYLHYFLKGKLLKPELVIGSSRMFGNIADGITTPSEKMRNISLNYGIRKPIKVIPNPVDTSVFDIPKKTFLQEKLHLSKNAPIILSVGRLGKEKNFAFIVKTFKKLAKIEKTSHLVIVGEGRLEEAKLVKLSGDLIDKRIHFAGQVSVEDMPFVYASAEIFVFASTSETQGLCVLEAAAAGLPLVLVNDGAYENMIVDGFNGFLLPQKQEVFVEKLIKLLEDDKLRKKFGKNSKEIAEKNFNPKLLTEKMMDYYGEVLQEYKPYRVKDFNKKVKIVLSKTAQLLDEFFNNN